jgi:hypothetical protein
MPRDSRILDTYRHYAIINALDVPSGVDRTEGVYAEGSENNRVTAAELRPIIRDRVISMLDDEFPYTTGKGGAGDVVAVRLSDLEERGWTIKADDVPASIEPSGKHGNSGRTYSFVTGHNPVDGNLGWKPIDLAGGDKSPSFDPVAPIMAVHDLMEHFPGDEYDPHNEYQAQGAMLWLRFEGGFFSGQDLAQAVVKPAFGMLYHHITKGKLETKEWDGKPEEADPFRQMKQETAFTLLNLIGATKKFVDDKFRYDNAAKKVCLDSLQRGIPWIVRGYVRANERYKGLDKYRLVHLYRSVADRIANPVEGSTLKLTMSYERYVAQVEMVTPISA